MKKVIIGEPMPDENDPKYRERAEEDRKAGQQFAHTVGLDKVAACIQKFASTHSRLFLGTVFSFVVFCITLNLYRMTQAVSAHQEQSSAVKRQEKVMKLKRHHAGEKISNKTESGSQTEKINENDEYSKYVNPQSEQLELEEYGAKR